MVVPMVAWKDAVKVVSMDTQSASWMVVQKVVSKVAKKAALLVGMMD